MIAEGGHGHGRTTCFDSYACKGEGDTNWVRRRRKPLSLSLPGKAIQFNVIQRLHGVLESGSGSITYRKQKRPEILKLW